MHASDAKAARATPGTFLAEVRDEAAKVTWPSRRETLVTTGMVFALVVVSTTLITAIDMTLRTFMGAALYP